ncbi:MAG TPA: ABC transporter substrate-binding protein [Acidimicrobiales bacterium]|nr:ABC transporter substrate-binding protein [Acidimicrobiales bacterium]
MLVNKVKVSLAAGLVASTLTGVALTSGSASASTSCNTATSAAACGGMSALIKAAKKEGRLNVITLPPNWANYGNIIKDFSKKYGIKVDSYNPNGSSANEITAVKSDRGRSSAPDVLDVGTSFAADNLNLLAPYKVATWSNIPAGLKNSKGYWFDDYGGYVAIGCNTKVVTTCPTSFKDLLRPAYKNEVGINGDPTQASAAFSAVFAASLANGGSFNNIQPGIDFFKSLNAAGNFVPGSSGSATAGSGATPIIVWWDYLQASEIAATIPTWKIVIPSDASYAAYYSQAISATAPDPAAARLWEEYLYSTVGQNLWLEGSTRPVELASLVSAGTVNKAAYAKLPAAPKNTSYPTLSQLTTASATVAANWAAAVGG